MDAISSLSIRPVTYVPVQPVPAARPVTREGTGRVALLPDTFARSGTPAKQATYGRDGSGGS